MNILIVVPALPVNLQDIKGGVHSALANLLTGFSNADVVVRVLSFNRELSAPIVVQHSVNITIYYTPENKTLPHVLNYLWAGAASVKKHVAEFNADIVHYAMSGYILFTKLFGLPTVQVLTIHGMAFREARQKKTVKEKLVWYTNGIAELMLCPDNSIHLSNYAHDLFTNKTNGQSTIIPNAVSPGYFLLNIKKATNNQLLYIGGIDANKNILLLLQSLQILALKKVFYQLCVLGDFTDMAYKETVVAFIAENDLGNQVKFLGWTAQPALQKIMEAADTVVVCSRQESLPMVIAEAMSAGKVVVASAVGGIPEMVSDGIDGFTFNIAVVQNLVDKLQLLYNNDALVLQIQTAAREKAQRVYHCNSVAKQTMAFYQLLLKKQYAQIGLLQKIAT